jgi:hypothetical protein
MVVIKKMATKRPHLFARSVYKLPYAAPSTGGFERISPTGAMQGCISFFAGAGCLFEKPRSKPAARRIQVAWGGLFFEYFLLAKQKKVSRLPVREPALNQASR